MSTLDAVQTDPALLDALNQIVLKQQVIEVGLRYARAIDDGDIDLFRSCFTEDALWVSSVHEARGRQQIGEVLARTAASLDGTLHLATNFEVSLSGNRAKMRSCFHATHIKLPLEHYVMGGIYDDELINTNDGWCFVARRLRIQWVSGDEAVVKGVVG